ncbi:MAG: 50S ribosomal protein L10 [Candidatus Aenigmarchaeota archaeon]|nr:50S ribosomal protein L10 [Candidatus Aenigmarchaeota archaeon]
MKKENEVKELADIMNSHSVIGILDMHKMPARQLQMIRNKLRGKAVIRMSKKSLIRLAIENVQKKDINPLQDVLDTCGFEPAILATNENPFRIYKFLKDNRSPAAAKPGDKATKDIMIQKGPTSLPPGPAISTLQKVGLKASVQGGKIAILQDKVVCKEGETINDDLAGVLSLLKIEPMEIGLRISHVYEDGTLYEKSVLDIDMDDYLKILQNCIHEAINLSVNTGYPTKETIRIMLQKAFIESKSLCIETNAMEKDFIDEILMKAVRQAMTLNSTTEV